LKRIAIITDLEGISGIDTMDMVKLAHPETCRYPLERLMADVNAAVDGAFAGGADEVYVWDGHGSGYNFLEGALDRRAVQMRALECDWFRAHIDAAFIIGQHAMAGTINGFLDHTQSSMSWFNYSINGRNMGEIGQIATFLGVCGIPLVMLSGDEAACVEAKALLGDICCAPVKYGVGRNHAHLLPESKAEARIREAACEAVGRIGQIRPLTLSFPLEVKLTLYRSDFCDDVAAHPGVERLDARTVRKVVHEVNAYRDIMP